MEERLRFSFNKESDILDISVGRPKKAISREIDGDFFIRVDPKTNEIVGFSILNFEKWFKSQKEGKIVPIRANFLLAK